MNEELLLSFILPCYNTGKYVKQCIDSLYKQGMDEGTFEVIFVNNATEDNSEEIVFDIKKKHSNFVYIKLEKNICAGGAYNKGLEIAKGKFIQFVDSDDYLKENTIHSFINMMEDDQLDALYFNIESFRGDSELTYQNRLLHNGNFPESFSADNGNEYLKKALTFLQYKNLPVPAYRKMIRRNVLVNNNVFFTHTTVGCDYLHNQQLLSCARKIKVIPDKAYMFRYNPEGVTKSRVSPNSIIYALNNHCKAYKELINAPFDFEIKNIITANILSLLNSYFGGMKYIDSNSRTFVLNNIEDSEFIKSVLCGTINKILFKDGFVSHYFLKASLMKTLKAIKERF